MENNFFEFCELLLEAHKGDYHRVYGYVSFGEWVEGGSQFDFSARQAYYFVNIAKKAEELGLDKEEIRSARVTNIKEIFTLDTAVFGEEMRTLVSNAPHMTVNEVKDAVALLKAKDLEEPKVFVTLRLPKSIKEKLDEAFELVRRVGGADFPNDVCLEYILQEYIQSAPQQEESLA
jgi:hypothetical protein